MLSGISQSLGVLVDYHSYSQKDLAQVKYQQEIFPSSFPVMGRISKIPHLYKLHKSLQYLLELQIKN